MGERVGYATSHPVIPMSSKRFAASPFLASYHNDQIVFGAYGGRLYALRMGEDPEKAYWHLRTHAVLFDVPERPVEIRGPDAEALLDRLLTRDLSRLRVGRAAYGLACYPDGGVLMDGVVLRLGADRFRYVLADGEFDGWLRAHADGLDVRIEDPRSWVLQVQGPTSLAVFAAACDHPVGSFRYFDVVAVEMGGQRVLASRTGWSGELGFEVYTEASTDAAALWAHLLEVGADHQLQVQSLESLGTRRIEAGILDNGTDIDPSLDAFAAGLGRFVDLDKPDFVGRDALAAADRRPRLLGVTAQVTPRAGDAVWLDGEVVGVVTIGTWSPAFGHGIGYVRFAHPGDWVGASITIGAADAPATVVPLPFYDPEKKIARGATTALDSADRGRLSTTDGAGT